VLVDDDILLPGNLVRHQLGWESIGTHKVDATKEAILQLIPNAGVAAYKRRIAGQESAVNAANLLNAAAKCDVIIDATAEPLAFLTLASLARRYRRCLCWGEIFAGGIGGVIARAWPGIDAHPLAIRAGIQSFLDAQSPAPFQQADGYEVDTAIPLIATDADVSLIAGALTALVLEVLCGAAPRSFAHPAYLIGLRKEWIFEGAFDTQPIAVPFELWEEEKNLGMVSDEIRGAVLLAMAEMLPSTTDNADVVDPS
jgi:hypothetical protein